MWKIDFHYAMDPPFHAASHEQQGIGGTENFILQMAEYLSAAVGREVRIFNRSETQSGAIDGTRGGDHKFNYAIYPLRRFDPREPRDVLVSFRARDVFHQNPNARLKMIVLADKESYGLGDDVRAGLIDLVVFVSQWQADKIAREERLNARNFVVSSNATKVGLFEALRGRFPRISGQCIHSQTPERGLDQVVDVWPAIQAGCPEATLVLYSSFYGWGVSTADNEMMCEGVYGRIRELQAQGMSIDNRLHCAAPEMRRELLQSQVYLYPTSHFDETCCILALEANAAGLPIVATERGAMQERVDHNRTGFLVPEGEDHNQQFADAVVELLTSGAAWRMFSQASVEKGRQYDYDAVTNDWIKWLRGRLR